MTNLKKYPSLATVFVLFLTLALSNCGTNQPVISSKTGTNIPITDAEKSVVEIEAVIEPYRNSINQDLSTVLAYAPHTFDKSKGKWQTDIGVLMADASLEKGNQVFKARENKTIDICLLNHGGIRAIIPMGDVTTRTAFEIMPFENSLVVATLKAEQILELVDYIIAEKKPHPLSGLSFEIEKGLAKNIKVQGEPLDANRSYLVATSDYLLTGGDRMDFFKKSVYNYDLDYKIRNILIDYFKDTDTLRAATDVRIREVSN